MSTITNRQWVLAKRPMGMVQTSDFELRETDIAEPADGQVLVRNLMVSFDPAMRGWMMDVPSYLPPVGIGEVMRATGAGQVVASRHEGFSPGDLVQGLLGWQEHALVAPGHGRIRKIPAGISLAASLGVFGITGLTAYFGMLEIGRPESGQTVLVSGAAGATGSIAGQIAKIRGCRVVGIAGGERKCQWLTQEAGLDAAIDYKSENLRARVAELCPDGVHTFFDNVGGDSLEAALANLAQGGRIALCGAISRYNAAALPPGPRNYTNLIVRRGTMQGFIVLDFLDRAPGAIAELAAWVRAGKLKHREDVQEGFSNIPSTFLRLFGGANFGKQLLKIADAE